MNYRIGKDSHHGGMTISFDPDFTVDGRDLTELGVELIRAFPDRPLDSWKGENAWCLSDSFPFVLSRKLTDEEAADVEHRRPCRSRFYVPDMDVERCQTGISELLHEALDTAKMIEILRQTGELNA